MTKPEANGPFLVYDVPDFPGAEAGTEHRGFYILFPIDHRFPEGNIEVNFYTGYVKSDNEVVFKFPAWPYPLYPGLPNTKLLYQALTSVLPEYVTKSMNNIHAFFDNEHEDTALVESRKWEYVTLDFSQVKGMDELALSSRVLFADAGEKESLDYNYHEVPLYYSGASVTHYQAFLGFMVGTKPKEGTQGGRKVKRSAATKSKLHLMKEEAARKHGAGGGLKTGS